MASLNKNLPRVHQVMEILYPRGWEDQEALNNGTHLHAWMAVVMESVLSGESLALPESTKSRLDKLTNWCAEQQIQPLQIEQRIESPQGYCGTPDLYCLWKKERWVLDWKFAESITEANLMQGEAYRYLIAGTKVALIQIPKLGPVKVHKLKKRPDLWAIFLSAKNVWRFRNGKHSVAA